MKDPIDKEIRTEIMRRIKAAEQEHNVKVLFAIESGSRAWGFASPNSDYDVRFIYAHPQDWYLDINVEGKRDVIEYPIVDEIDINGWDIRKALMLFWKSNPAFVEWIQSPIVYVDDGIFSKSVRALLPSIYAHEKGIYHYKHMAKTNYRGYLRKDLVPLKKYFYVLRPLLAIKWLEGKNEPAPIEFDILRTLVKDNQALSNEIEKLLSRKKASMEKDLIPQVPAINDFIERELERLEDYADVPEREAEDMKALNVLFKSLIAGV
jgi:predicted nucleotidyltransferase